MKHIEFDEPTPFCVLTLSHPARAYTPAFQTDISISINQHRIDRYSAEIIQRIEYNRRMAGGEK